MMARASVSPGTFPAQTTDDVRCVVSDEPRTAPAAPVPEPDGLPYGEVDILARGADHYVAGGALLAELVRHAVDTRLDAGETGKAEAEAMGAAALAKEDDLLGELTAPSQNLTDTMVKLAYAWRVAWWGSHGGGGVYGNTALELVASALSDVILLREAEVERRRRIAEDGR
jgi:hypothetical protein